MLKLATNPIVKAGDVDRKKRGLLLVVLLASQALAAMDTSIANVAAPVIQRELSTGGSVLQAIVAGYVLAYAVLLITGARMGDHFGYRRMFTVGIALFTVASVLCGAAEGGATLIGARVAQGIGAALFVPQILSIIQRAYQDQQRARVLGYYSAILAAGVAAGQLVGGLVVTEDFLGQGWRAAFFMNLPIGIVLGLGARLIPSELKPNQRPRLDLIGLAVLVPSIALIVTPLLAIREVGLNLSVAFAIVLGVAGLLTFSIIQRSIKSHGGTPLVDMDLLGTPSVRSSLSIIAMGFANYAGLLFSTSLFVQNALAFSPIGSGLVFCCYALGFGIANVCWPKLVPKHLIPKTTFAALMVLGASQAALAAICWNLGWRPFLHLPLLLVSGMAHGLAFGPVVSFASSKISPASAGLLSGLVTTMVQAAIVLGIATLGSVFLWQSAEGLPLHAVACTSMGCAALALLSLFPAAANVRQTMFKEI